MLSYKDKTLQRQEECLSNRSVPGTASVASYLGFKLPHYLNIVFPTGAVMAASLLL
ncbi:MAG: hypothetical protein IPK57_15570 [Chitinophagaceae bacterium]|nr:hypothetical protein [Chitinophagaceae bacterium]